MTIGRKPYNKQHQDDIRERRRAKRKEYYLVHKDELLAKQRQHQRKCGGLPMSENRQCSSFLGVHVAERVLAKVFKDVEVMPHNNPGYDFICGKGYKIDVKCACIKKKKNSWGFNIKKNTIADYFLCLAFDDRDNLEPQHIWLIPSDHINNLTGLTISSSTLQRWSKYELDKLDKIISCCNVIKGDE